MLDTHNDYLYENGKRHASLRESLDETNPTNLEELVMAARIAQMPIVYGMHQSQQHHHIESHSHNSQWHGADSRESLFDDIDEGSWEAEIYRGVEPKSSNGNVIVSRHWKQRFVMHVFLFICNTAYNFPTLSSAFANTDLDYQLKKRNITNVVIAGLISGTRFASTARYASEL